MSLLMFGKKGSGEFSLPSSPDGLRIAPTREWQYLLGPQTTPNTVPSGWTDVPPNMETYFTYRVDEFYTKLTNMDRWISMDGTVNVTNGSSTVTGVGTTGIGTEIVANYGACRIYDTAAGRWRYFRPASVNSGAQTLVLGLLDPETIYGTETSWPGTSQTGLTIEAPYVAVSPALSAADAWGTYNYYDTVRAIYQAWFRQDNCDPDSVYLAKAREIVAFHAEADNHQNFESPYGWGATPRGSGLHGLIFAAHDNHPEYWPAITAYITYYNHAWLGRYQTGGVLENSMFTTRDGAYMLDFTAHAAVVHPDTTQRNTFRDRAISLALDPCIKPTAPSVDFFGPDDAYLRWLNPHNFDADDDGFYDNGDYENGQTDSGVVGGGGTGASQPFQDSLMLNALRSVLRMMQFHGLDSGTDWNTIKAGFLAGVKAWRAAYVHGGNMSGYELARYTGYWSGKDTHFEKYGVAVAAAPVDYSSPFISPTDAPSGFGISNSGDGTGDVNLVHSARQGQADGIANLGFAYALTGDSSYNALTWEHLDSCFRANYINPPQHGGPNYDITGGDGRMSLYQVDTQKNHNQHYGNGEIMKTLGWFVGGLEDFS